MAGLLGVAGVLPLSLAPARPSAPVYDVVIRDGLIVDGSGGEPYRGMVAIRGDRIVYVGRARPGRGRTEIDAHGKAVAPGFINMLSHAEESLLVDRRALSDLAQGVTLEVLGESSMGPLAPWMQKEMVARQGDIRFPVTWSTLGGYFDALEKRGFAPNVASFVGASNVRLAVIGPDKVDPTPTQIEAMRKLVGAAMEEGAVGLTAALIYAPDTFTKTPELVALARESARCGGFFSAHMRGEGNGIETAIDEMATIARASGGPAHIYHLKLAGRDNWGKRDAVLAKIEALRAQGLRITADMYPYAVAGTGLDASMPTWVQSGGYEAWRTRLRDPETRARVIAEMRMASPPGWENYLVQSGGAAGLRMLAFRNPALKPLTGKTLAEIAAMRGVTPEDAAIDLVIEDGSRVEVAYSLMSEANVAEQYRRPWIAVDSDSGALAPEPPFLGFSPHPRAYGAFARFLGKYVREERVMSLAEGVRRLTGLPADILFLKDRGRLKPGYFADVVLFDPARIRDNATFEQPHQLAEGVEQVLVNGRFALRDGRPTGAATGRVVRGRGWSGGGGGGCRSSAVDGTRRR